jgi:hypothetical protein
VYPDAAGEAALRDAHQRRTAVEIRRMPSDRPARPTQPIAGTFVPAAPLPFAPAAEPVSRTSLSPVATSGSLPRWSATSGDALPAASRRRAHVAVMAVGVAIAVGCVAALAGRAAHRTEASAAPPAVVVVAPPPAAPEPAEAAPSADATPPAAAATTGPRAKAKQESKAAPKAAPTASAPRAPHRPFDVDAD